MPEGVIGSLRVILGLDSAQFEKGITRSRRQLTPLQKSMGTLSTAARAMGAALGVASAGLAGRKYLQLADESKTLTAQLKLATAQFGSFNQAQEDVKRIASATRTDLKATADLYSTLQRNAGELGISQEQTARTTETITKAFRISGASAAEAAGGLRQFLQGIQSGTLRGEELNSVLENAPRLARALADGLGVTIGQLREMGEAGELTGEKVLNALEGAADQIDKEFSELPVTFEEAMTTLHNAAVVTFGAFDRGGQFSTALANFVTQGTGGFGDLEVAAESFGAKVSAELAGAMSVGRQFIGTLQSIRAWMNSLAGSSGIFNRVEKDTISAFGPLGFTNPVGLAVRGIRMSPQYQNAKEARETEAAMERINNVSLQDILSGAGIKSAPAPRISLPPTPGVSGGGGGGRRSGGGGGGGTSQAARDAKQLETAWQGLLDKLEPLRAEADRYHDSLAIINDKEKEGAITAERAYALRTSLVRGLYKESGAVLDEFLRDADKSLVESLHVADIALAGFRDKAENNTVQIAKSFKDMADETLAAFDRVVGAIQGGGFLNILSGVIGLGMQLGSIGLFGKTIQTNINSVPKFANGGAFTVRGMAGIDTNVLSINGIPQAMVSSGEKVSVSPQSNGIGPGGGVTRVEVIPSRYFDVAVDGRIVQASPAIADAGGSIGVERARAAGYWNVNR